jgi:hypothetical protein
MDEWDDFPDAQAAQDEWGDFPDVQAAPQAPAQQQEQPPVMGGMGGYNPFAGRLMGGAQVINDAVGIQPTDKFGMAETLGPAEAALSGVTSAAALPLSGIAGIASSPFTDPAKVIERVKQLLTYRPRTNIGAGMANVAGMPGQAWSGATTRAGEFVTDKTGSPALGAFIKTTGDIAPAVASSRMSGPRVARTSEPKRTGDYQRPAPDPIPTTAELTSAAKDAYKQGKESGVVVPADNYSKALERIHGVVKEEGISDKLHPKTSALLQHLDESSGKNLTITEAENLRRVIQEVAGDLDPVTRKPTADAFRASKILDEFDDAVEQLSVNSEARALWSRSRRSQMIDDMIERAETKAGAHYTQAGMEHALRQEFKQLALNPRRMRGLTKAQKVAIVRVARGGAMENTLRALGKFDPTTGGVAALASVGTGSLLAPLTGGAGLALPALGFGAKRLATRATSRNVDAAREALVGRGMPNAAQRATAPPTRSNAAKPTSPEEVKARVQAKALEKVQTEIQRLLEEAERLQAGASGGSKGK